MTDFLPGEAAQSPHAGQASSDNEAPLFALTRTVHAWLGTVLSLLLVVLGTSGAPLVFKDDYLRANVTEARASIATL